MAAKETDGHRFVLGLALGPNLMHFPNPHTLTIYNYCL